mmetsp:Transcript_36196/g.91095  ORF Transcript_36196/g.91095 Transcript_36196/m.91095 type:complete len:210 (+) Transcript_36196:665-1294(+)
MAFHECVNLMPSFSFKGSVRPLANSNMLSETDFKACVISASRWSGSSGLTQNTLLSSWYSTSCQICASTCPSSSWTLIGGPKSLCSHKSSASSNAWLINWCGALASQTTTPFCDKHSATLSARTTASSSSPICISNSLPSSPGPRSMGPSPSSSCHLIFPPTALVLTPPASFSSLISDGSAFRCNSSYSSWVSGWRFASLKSLVSRMST